MVIVAKFTITLLSWYLKNLEEIIMLSVKFIYNLCKKCYIATPVVGCSPTCALTPDQMGLPQNIINIKRYLVREMGIFVMKSIHLRLNDIYVKHMFIYTQVTVA